jgi:hypothetical protein
MAGLVDIHQDTGLVMGASILVLLRAFANGGSSLTGGHLQHGQRVP